MKNLNNKINSFFSNIDALASMIFRFGIGIAFIIHGANKPSAIPIDTLLSS